jgi:xylitol oxidase
MEIVTANGEVAVVARGEDSDFTGAAVGLGGLGVVTKLTLDVVPTFDVSQVVYEQLPWEALGDHLDDIYSAAYSVSLFTNWQNEAINQVWLKQLVNEQGVAEFDSEFFGAKRAFTPRHPLPDHDAENCTDQLGIPGPWHERLPHFRMEFTPSSGEELQSEYFVPRHLAHEALCAVDRLKEFIAPILHISEIRTIAADELWMSPCYKQDSVGIHFTWRKDWDRVRHILPIIEEQLAPYQARPHWGKLFTMPPERVRSLYTKLPDFQNLLLQYDPQGKFRNGFLEKYIVGE